MCHKTNVIGGLRSRLLPNQNVLLILFTTESEGVNESPCCCGVVVVTVSPWRASALVFRKPATLKLISTKFVKTKQAHIQTTADVYQLLMTEELQDTVNTSTR